MTAKVAIGSSLAVNWTCQIQHGDDAVRTKVKVPADKLSDFFIRNTAGAKSINKDRYRFRYADSIGQLNFTAVCNAGSYQVLGYITGCIGCGTVNLCRILTGESSAAMTGHTTVSIDDNLAPGKPRIPMTKRPVGLM